MAIISLFLGVEQESHGKNLLAERIEEGKGLSYCIGFLFVCLFAHCIFSNLSRKASLQMDLIDSWKAKHGFGA